MTGPTENQQPELQASDQPREVLTRELRIKTDNFAQLPMAVQNLVNAAAQERGHEDAQAMLQKESVVLQKEGHLLRMEFYDLAEPEGNQPLNQKQMFMNFNRGTLWIIAMTKEDVDVVNPLEDGKDAPIFSVKDQSEMQNILDGLDSFLDDVD